tara:strand:+ start:94 stop:423 length:330 start_codon:yes stop_codon:yes gene_type:complete
MPRGYTGDWDRMNRRYYDEGYDDGYRDGYEYGKAEMKDKMMRSGGRESMRRVRSRGKRRKPARSKPRKLSKWQQFVKTNAKKKEFRFRNGKVNLKKLGVAYRKKQRGRK